MNTFEIQGDNECVSYMMRFSLNYLPVSEADVLFSVLREQCVVEIYKPNPGETLLDKLQRTFIGVRRLKTLTRTRTFLVALFNKYTYVLNCFQPVAMCVHCSPSYRQVQNTYKCIVCTKCTYLFIIL